MYILHGHNLSWEGYSKCVFFGAILFWHAAGKRVLWTKTLGNCCFYYCPSARFTACIKSSVVTSLSWLTYLITDLDPWEPLFCGMYSRNHSLHSWCLVWVLYLLILFSKYFIMAPLFYIKCFSFVVPSSHPHVLCSKVGFKLIFKKKKKVYVIYLKVAILSDLKRELRFFFFF